MKKVIVMGNLVGDAEIRSLESGTKVMNFTLAVNSKYKNKQGEYVERADFFDCFQFKTQGDFTIAPHLTKGKKLVVEGEPEVRAYISQKTNEAVGQMRIKLDRIHFAGGSKSKDALAGEPNANEFRNQQEDDLPF